MAAFVAKQMVGNKLNAVKGEYNDDVAMANHVKMTLSLRRLRWFNRKCKASLEIESNQNVNEI